MEMLEINLTNRLSGTFGEGNDAVNSGEDLGALGGNPPPCWFELALQ